jgi:hypothetical protein
MTDILEHGPSDTGTGGKKGPAEASVTGRRKHLPLWDRVKFLLLFALLFVFLVATELDNPLLPVSEAIRHTVETRWWLLALAPGSCARSTS